MAANVPAIGATLEIGSLQLQLLHEIVPAATKFGLLINPTSPSLANAQAQDLQGAARSFGLEIGLLRASDDSEVDAAFAQLTKLRVGGLVISADPCQRSHRAAAEAKRKIRAKTQRLHVEKTNGAVQRCLR